jgi:hypothetical protein
MWDIQIFDPTSRPPEEDNSLTSFVAFHQDYGLAGENGPTTAGFAARTLPNIMEDLGHTRLNVLKIDIKG